MARTKRFVDLTGKRFGKYTVLSHVIGQHWLCRCDCGVEKNQFSPNLLTGQTTMCRDCSNKARIIDLTGQRFGKWTVLSLATPTSWNCRCDCGTESVVARGNLKSGKSTQCVKCYNADRPVKHGHSPGDAARSITYQVWVSIKQRCGTQFSPYGGKGVCICQGWSSDFNNFLASMGERPSLDVSIDRANKDESTRHYSCGNCDECREKGWISHCRWATQSEQMRNVSTNKWITHNGETRILADWAKITGLPSNTITRRIKNGWSIEDALNTPANKRKR